MSLQKLKQLIASGEMYNDLSPELIQAREDTFLLLLKQSVISVISPFSIR